MKIHEVAKLSGVTVRTLQYYDSIELLKPSEVLENGYRDYSDDDLATLQQILFFRELNFPLKEIRDMMQSPNYNQTEALKKQKELLTMKRTHLDNLIHLVDAAIKGEPNMSLKEFNQKEYESKKDAFAKEAKERWGNTKAYQEYEEKTKKDGSKQDMFYAKGVTEIMKKFASIRTSSPESKESQALVKEWQDYITDNFYNCTNQILSCLGQMYIGDERFKNNIDSHGEGTAEFIAQAITYYCK